MITVIGLQFGALLSGADITETVFARKGIGRLAVDSILNRDYPSIAIMLTVLSANLLGDSLRDILDPRLRQ